MNTYEFSPDGEEGYDLYRDSTLHGIGRPYVSYVDITAEVCQSACSQLHGDSCCSLVYDRTTRTCHITPLELNTPGVELQPELYTDYYKRRKCEGRWWWFLTKSEISKTTPEARPHTYRDPVEVVITHFHCSELWN